MRKGIPWMGMTFLGLWSSSLAAEPVLVPDAWVETLFVSATGMPVQSHPLEPGATYRVEARGMYALGACHPYTCPGARPGTALWADAAYGTADGWADFGPALIDAPGGLRIDGYLPDWGDYAPEHIYALEVTGEGRPLSFHLRTLELPVEGFVGGLSIALYRVLTGPDAAGDWVDLPQVLEEEAPLQMELPELTAAAAAVTVAAAAGTLPKWPAEVLRPLDDADRDWSQWEESPQGGAALLEAEASDPSQLESLIVSERAARALNDGHLGLAVRPSPWRRFLAMLGLEARIRPVESGPPEQVGARIPGKKQGQVTDGEVRKVPEDVGILQETPSDQAQVPPFEDLEDDPLDLPRHRLSSSYGLYLTRGFCTDRGDTFRELPEDPGLPPMLGVAGALGTDVDAAFRMAEVLERLGTPVQQQLGPAEEVLPVSALALLLSRAAQDGDAVILELFWEGQLRFVTVVAFELWAERLELWVWDPAVGVDKRGKPSRYRLYDAEAGGPAVLDDVPVVDGALSAWSVSLPEEGMRRVDLLIDDHSVDFSLSPRGKKWGVSVALGFGISVDPEEDAWGLTWVRLPEGDGATQRREEVPELSLEEQAAWNSPGDGGWQFAIEETGRYTLWVHLPPSDGLEGFPVSEQAYHLTTHMDTPLTERTLLGTLRLTPEVAEPMVVDEDPIVDGYAAAEAEEANLAPAMWPDEDTDSWWWLADPWLEAGKTYQLRVPLRGEPGATLRFDAIRLMLE